MMNGRWFDDLLDLRHALVGELDKEAQALFTRLSRLPSGLALLRVLHAHANTLFTLEDIAYKVGSAPERVGRDLDTLITDGLVRRVSLTDTCFYGLTTEPARRRIIHQLMGWQDRWHQRLARLEQVIRGESVPSDTIPIPAKTDSPS